MTERNNRSKTKLISDPLELYRFLATPGIEVQNLTFVGQDACCVSWRYSVEEHIPNLKHTNEVVGAFVTTGARVHLYRYLDRVQERALYCDTDSVIYVQPNDIPPLIETGDSLGDMASELKAGHYIREFVSGGPKNYAYKVYDSVTGAHVETVCKVRGITLNYTTSQQVNFDVIRNMVLGGETSADATVLVHTDKRIKRKKGKASDCGSAYVSIVTEPEDKTYRLSFFKRRRLSDNTSVPFGYK